MLGRAIGDEVVFLKFMLASGFREREARFEMGRTSGFCNSVVRVTAKSVWALGLRIGTEDEEVNSNGGF
jgi:hypothetical protein